MEATRRTWWLWVVVAGLAAGAFVATRFLRDSEPLDASAAMQSAAATGAAASTARPSNDPPDPPSPLDPRDAGEATPSATRAAESGDPLLLPDRNALEELEARGHALFVGVVTDFDGAPCPGAVVWHAGVAVGMSDALGRFRVEVAQNTWNPMDEARWSNRLAAVKEGVGAGAVDCDGVSRRIDLGLQWRALFAGRCVERQSGAPVPNAQLELQSFLDENHGPLFTLTTRADEKGAFRFVGIAPGMAELSARAAKFASDGWFPFDVSTGADRTSVEFQLERIAHARGWFDPWPPPWIAGDAAAAAARIVAIQGAGRSSGPVSAPLAATIATGGAFDVPFATCNGFDLLLEADGGALWNDHVAPDWEGNDVDFGRVPLLAPAALTGRVNLPRDVLELGFELLVVARTAETRRLYRFPIGLDGRFRAEPLPPGRLLWGVVLGNALAIGLTLREFRGEEEWLFGDEEELEGGRVRDLGDVVPQGRMLAGRVTDATGRAAPGASLQLPLTTSEGTFSFGGFGGDGEGDAQGRYLVKIELDEESSTGRAIEEALASAPVVLFGRRLCEVGRADPFRLPAKGQATRVDLRLAPGLVLRGHVVGAHGQPLAKTHVSLGLDPLQGVVPLWFEQLSVMTDADGAFELGGLDDVEYEARALKDDEWIALGRVRPGGDPVTLPRSVE